MSNRATDNELQEETLFKVIHPLGGDPPFNPIMTGKAMVEIKAKLFSSSLRCGSLFSLARSPGDSLPFIPVYDASLLRLWCFLNLAYGIRIRRANFRLLIPNN